MQKCACSAGRDCSQTKQVDGYTSWSKPCASCRPALRRVDASRSLAMDGREGTVTTEWGDLSVLVDFMLSTERRVLITPGHPGIKRRDSTPVSGKLAPAGRAAIRPATPTSPARQSKNALVQTGRAGRRDWQRR